jgi:putative PEP-CTERM system histidine kinase
MTAADLMDVAMWSYGVAAGCFLALAVRLIVGWRPGLRAALLLAVVLMTCVWATAGVVVIREPSIPAWVAFTYADSLRYAVWFMFLGTLIQGAQPSLRALWSRTLPRSAVVVVVLALLACFVLVPMPPFLNAVASASVLPFALRLALAIVGLIFVEQLLRRAEPSARWALMPLCIGLAGVFAFDLYFYSDATLLSRFDVELWVARGAANALVIPFLLVATARNPGLAIGMHVSRNAIFHSTAIVVCGAFLLLVAAAGYLVRFMGGEWGRALQVLFFFFALLAGVLVVSSGRFRAKLRVFIGKHFFPYRYDYREEWLRFTRTLGDSNGIHDVKERAIKALSDLVESPAGALWLRGDDAAYRLAARLNMPVPAEGEAVDAAFPAFLERTGWIVDLDDCKAAPARHEGLELPSWICAMPAAWLVVPLISGAELAGFVVLAKSRVAVDVNWEVRDLLKVAGSQVATHLAEFRATEALVEARKFDAFNRMSAFVVHDLKNLVAQLSLMQKNAQRHRDNPEFQRDMQSTVEHVVVRMQQLMLQLQAGGTPLGKPSLVSLDTVLRNACAGRGADASRIAIEPGTGIGARAHEDRLEHVLGHIVQNALDATAAGGKVSVRVYRQDDLVVIEVADDGVGMDADFMRKRLFKPFETSKPQGMGIGVYESAQYVAAIGGRILFDSTPAVGTRVRVLLPALDSTSQDSRAEAAA